MEFGRRHKAEQRERLLEEITNLVDEERRFCREDGSNVEFSLVGGVEANIFPDAINDQNVINHVLAFVSDASSFYIGGTSSPSWRWTGGISDRPPKPMEGHRERWGLMRVIAICEGAAAGVLERELILECRARYPELIDTVANDSRGLSKNGLQFLYVCVGI